MLAVARQNYLPAEVRHPDTGFVDPKKASFSSEVGNKDNTFFLVTTCVLFIFWVKKEKQMEDVYMKRQNLLKRTAGIGCPVCVSNFWMRSPV